MKIILILTLAVTALSIGCAARPLNLTFNQQFIPTGAGGDVGPVPKLMLEVHPRVGFAPLRVSVRAQLNNVPQTGSDVACLWQSWKFGDGSVSSEKSECDNPLSEMHYDHEHIYRKPGSYVVQFVLGDTQVLSNPVQIRVLGEQ